jgi:hypothetical protein
MKLKFETIYRTGLLLRVSAGVVGMSSAAQPINADTQPPGGRRLDECPREVLHWQPMPTLQWTENRP